MNFDTSRRFTPWLYSVAHRTAIDTSRRRKVRKTSLLNEQLTDGAVSALEQVDMKYDVELVVGKLDGRSREYLALWQRSGGQLTLDEAAEALGVSRSTAFNVKNKVLEALEYAYVDQCSS